MFAASSLTDAFTEIGEAFATAHAGEIDVQFSFASSSVLATQINEGAPADVFASANPDQMEVVVAAGNADRPEPFAANVIALAAPSGSEAVLRFDDIAKPGVILVAAGPAVPAGALFHASLDALVDSEARTPAFAEAVLNNVVSEEANVRAVLAKVQLGEADAGFVYRTDIAVAGEAVREVAIPAAGRVSTEYLIASVGDSPGSAAREFVQYVQSEDARAILASYGFESVR